MLPRQMARPVYFLGYAVTATGTGLVLPIVALYVSAALGLGPGGVAFYYGSMAAASLVVTPIAGRVAARLGPRPVLHAGLALQASGFLVLAVSQDLMSVTVAGAVAGLGNGAFYACLTPFLLSVFGEEGLSSLFGWQFAVANAAVAASAVIIMLAFTDPSPTTYRIVFVVNALTYIVHGVVLTLLPRRAKKADDDPAETDAQSGPTPWYRPFFDRRFVLIPLVQFGAVAFGIIQLDSVIPLVMNEDHGLGPSAVAVVLVVNGLSVVALQGAGNAVAQKLGARLTVVAAFGAWAVAALGLPAAVGLNGVPPLVVFAVYAFLFGIGEVLIAPAMQPWAVAVAPRASLPIYTAAVSLAFGAGQIIGPMIGTTLLGSFGSLPYLLCTAAGLALFALVAFAQGGDVPLGRASDSPEQQVTSARAEPD